MKVIVLSDVHAKIWALDAVLEQEREYDLLCFAGDMIDYGTAPAEVIERFQSCSRAVLVKGNHDGNAVRVFHTEDFRHVPAGQYKWVHHNLERMIGEQVAYIDSLSESAVFQADGWVYLVQHQYRPGSYEVIECRHVFEEHWRRHTPKEYWVAPRRRMVFGHTHRQCVHILGDGMEWLNPGSVSYHRQDDPDKDARYMVITDGSIKMRSLPYPREPLLKETFRQLKAGRMAEQEMRYFFYYFGDAPDFDAPLPNHDSVSG